MYRRDGSSIKQQAILEYVPLCPCGRHGTYLPLRTSYSAIELGFCDACESRFDEYDFCRALAVLVGL